MTGISSKKEWIVVVGILALVGIGALAAFRISGTMGIEERFENALGVSGGPGEETEGTGIFGFFLEGQPLLYAAIVLGLGILCYVIYRYYRI